MNNQLFYFIMKNVTIDKTSPQKEKTWREILDSLDVSESFLADLSKRNSIANLISTHFHLHGNKKFSVSIKGQPRGKVRVWRVK